jgi:flagellum-specific peptidoglycan hydrolase FlgJ
MKQAILETGWFKNNFLMSKNNLFGFRKVKYLRFETWKKSVEYYKKWQDERYTTKYKDYFDFLVKIKYATPKYPSHLKKISFSKKCN